MSDTGQLTPEEALGYQQKMIAMLEEERPDLWQEVYPRAYADTGAWYSPKYIAADMALTLLMDPLTMDVPTSAAYAVNLRATTFQCPTYFVHRDLLLAALNTEPPDDLAFADLNWPMPVLTFVLPIDAIQTPSDGALRFVSIARIGARENFIHPRMQWLQGIAPHPGGEEGLLFYGQSTRLVSFAGSIAVEPGRPISRLGSGLPQSFAYLEPREMGDPGRTLLREDPLDSSDEQFLTQVREIAVRLMLLMQYAPEQVEKGSMRRAKGVRKGKPVAELWTPNVIGARYKLDREPAGEGTGALKRGHWRVGHMRNQAHGPNHSLRRKQWIRPVWVG